MIFAFGYVQPFNAPLKDTSPHDLTSTEDSASRDGSDTFDGTDVHNEDRINDASTNAGGVGKSVQLVSEHYPPALAGDEGWDYHYVLTDDLNGDGRDETVHVIANISRYGNGSNDFMWDDGHVWQVYIEDADSVVTYLFSGWVQLGHLRVASLDHFIDPEMRGIGIVSEQGAGVTLYRAHYRGPGDFTVVEAGKIPILREAEPATE